MRAALKPRLLMAGAVAAAPPAKRARTSSGDGQGRAAADGETLQRNAAQAAAVASKLEQQLRGGALQAALVELASIVGVCDSVNVELATFGALDQLMADMPKDVELGPVIAVGEEPEEACAMLTLVGRYCQLWERPALAMGHFRAAAQAAGLESAAGLEAERRRKESEALIRWRQEALGSCVRWWKHQHKPAPYWHEGGFGAFRRMSTRPSDVIVASYPKCGTS